jgi:hypothetical protein
MHPSRTLCGENAETRAREARCWLDDHGNLNCHRPPPGRACGAPEDRLRRAIQYSAADVTNGSAAAYWIRPVKPGDDTCC